MKLSPQNLYSGLKAKIQKVAQDEYQMRLLSICHKTAAWYVKISLTGLHSLPKKNLFAEPASTLEHYRRNVLMYFGVEGRAPQGSVMAFKHLRTNQDWFLSVLWEAIKFISKQTSRVWTGNSVIGIFSDADWPCIWASHLTFLFSSGELI